MNKEWNLDILYKSYESEEFQHDFKALPALIDELSECAKHLDEGSVKDKLVEVLMLNEEFLTEAFSGENKKKFLDFVNAWGVVNGEFNLDSFMMGFRLGANFTYDTFVATDTPFQDLLKE